MRIKNGILLVIVIHEVFHQELAALLARLGVNVNVTALRIRNRAKRRMVHINGS